MAIDEHKTKQANLKRKLRELDRRITRLDRAIRICCGWWPDTLAVTKTNRAVLDQRRREVRRELKARPTL